jgi:hypothetical protein
MLHMTMYLSVVLKAAKLEVMLDLGLRVGIRNSCLSLSLSVYYINAYVYMYTSSCNLCKFTSF